MITIVIASVQARDSTTDESRINCFSRHLRRLNQLDLQDKEYHSNNEIEDCQLVIKKFKSEILKRFKNNGTLEQKHCIEDELRNGDWADVQMKLAVYESLSFNANTHMIDELGELSEKKLKFAEKYCTHEDEYGQLFDVYFNFEDKSDDDKMLMYCAQKYIIENELLDGFNLTLLQSDVEINCTNLIKEFIRHTDEGLVDIIKEQKSDATHEQLNCTLLVYEQQKHTEKLISTVIMGRTNLSNGQRMIEKRKFIEFMTMITHNVENCFN